MENTLSWLRANLGSTAQLTGNDAVALEAVEAIIKLYSDGYLRQPLIADAVNEMQPKSRVFAWHLIAKVMDWGDRATVWELAGLPAIEKPGRAKHEPAAWAKGGAA